jgi:cytochrome b561
VASENITASSFHTLCLHGFNAINRLYRRILQQKRDSFFGLQLHQWANANHDIAEKFFDIHESIAWVLIVLIILHLLAAFQHLFLKKRWCFSPYVVLTNSVFAAALIAEFDYPSIKGAS